MRKFFLLTFILLALPSLCRAQDVDQLIRKGERLVGSGKLDAAYSTFKKAVAIEPEHSIAISALAQIASFLKNHHDSAFWYTIYLYVEASFTGETEDIKALLDKEVNQIYRPGKLTVKVTPESAEIRLNGFRAGKGSVSLTTTDGTEFQIDVEAEDHHPATRKVKVVQAEDKVVTVNLQKIIYKGMLELKTLPASGVEVYVDTKKIGKDVRKVKLTEGKHLVCFKKKGYDRWWRFVTVPRNGNTLLETTMREQTRPDEPCTVWPDGY